MFCMQPRHIYAGMHLLSKRFLTATILLRNVFGTTKVYKYISASEGMFRIFGLINQRNWTRTLL